MVVAVAGVDGRKALAVAPRTAGDALDAGAGAGQEADASAVEVNYAKDNSADGTNDNYADDNHAADRYETVTASDAQSALAGSASAVTRGLDPPL
jgi:hypothetical protein